MPYRQNAKTEKAQNDPNAPHAAQPIKGKRWRCQQCPRFAMQQPPFLQGYDTVSSGSSGARKIYSMCMFAFPCDVLAVLAFSASAKAGTCHYKSLICFTKTCAHACPCSHVRPGAPQHLKTKEVEPAWDFSQILTFTLCLPICRPVQRMPREDCAWAANGPTAHAAGSTWAAHAAHAAWGAGAAGTAPHACGGQAHAGAGPASA